MVEIPKGKSPFYPGQPVPLELFVGRQAEIDRIMIRGAAQVALGKPVAIFAQGEYGIGKSSLASYVQARAEREYGLHGIYASLAGCRNLNDMAAIILEATMRSGAFDPARNEKIRNWLAKYIGKQEIFGFTLNLEAIKKDSPHLASAQGILSFLAEVLKRLEVKGIFLVLDEINGMASNPDFAPYIKGLIDSNALSKTPVPIMLFVCGVEEKRREMIRVHPPIDRVFDVVDIGVLSPLEMASFFRSAFDSVQMTIEDKALAYLTYYSAGFPKMMHLIGDAAYWLDKDGNIDEYDGFNAVMVAAEEVGTKYVDQQVIKALKSKDYQSILAKIAKMSPISMSFMKSDIQATLSQTEKDKIDNFLQRMKKLKVLRSGDQQGEYIFNMRMVRLYLFLQSTRQK